MTTTLARTGAAPGALRELARAAAIPVVCAVVLTGLLVAWVLTGGAGTIHRVRVQVTQAAVPARGYTATSAATIHSAGTYLTIRNLTGQADQLTAVTSPLARRMVLTERRSPSGSRTVVRELTVPAHGTLTLTALGDDAVLENPASYERRASVPLVLTFRHAGKVSVTATVSAPGSP
ncbi:MAG TPA: copper chaperone PCu(A)C [Streptosporangiaceae bacterium]|nr:copper chaperone PCu(A)C [Streptosporangiaceae bacterium]